MGAYTRAVLTETYAVTIDSDASGDGSKSLSDVYAGVRITGYIDSIKLIYSGSAASTCDVVITENDGGVNQAILTVSDNNTSVVKRPRATANAVADGAAASSTEGELILLSGTDVTVTIAQAGTSVTGAVTVVFVLLV